MHGPLAIFFIALGLLICSLVKELSKKSGISHNLLIISSGVLVGYFGQHLGMVGEANQMYVFINPKLILAAFFPVGMFFDNYNGDFYVFKREIVNIFFLSILGIFMNAVYIALVLKVVLFYDDL